MEKCLNCQFYDRRNVRAADGRATMWGQCRRAAPHLNPTTAKAYIVEGVWPMIRDDDWCGEWKIVARATVAPARIAPKPMDYAMSGASAASSSHVTEQGVSAVGGD